jgi:hypothetical protein
VTIRQATAEWVAPAWFAILVTWLDFAFGRNNVGLLVLVLCVIVVELFACIVVAGLTELKYTLKTFWHFWLKKSLLLMVPLLGAFVDFGYYFFSDPDTVLGSDIRRYVTKAMFIGVLGFQIREVLRVILLIHRDLPFAKLLMHHLDKWMRGGQDPPPDQQRREYDPARLKHKQKGKDVSSFIDGTKDW